MGYLLSRFQQNILDAIRASAVTEPPPEAFYIASTPTDNFSKIPSQDKASARCVFRYDGTRKGRRDCFYMQHEDPAQEFVSFICKDYYTNECVCKRFYVNAKKDKEQKNDYKLKDRLEGRPMNRVSKSPHMAAATAARIEANNEQKRREREARLAESDPDIAKAQQLKKEKAEADKEELEKSTQIKAHVCGSVDDIACPYLVKKGLNKPVSNYGLFTNPQSGTLIVPLTDGLQYVPKRSYVINNNNSYDFSNMKDFASVSGYDGKKRNHGQSTKEKIFIFGSLNGCKRIIIAEGVATGLAALEILNGNYNYNEDEVRRHVLICLCTVARAEKVSCILRAFKKYSVSKRNTPVMIVADNDWLKEENAGAISGEYLNQQLQDSGYKTIYIDTNQTRYQMDSNGKAMTDFCDLFQYGDREVLSAMIDVPLQEFYIKNDLRPEYTFPLREVMEEKRIGKYHSKQSIENKLDMTHFPKCLREYINVNMQGMWDENVASYVVAQITCDIGVIGSQMYTISENNEKDYASLFLMVISPTAGGKSSLLRKAGRLADHCTDIIRAKTRKAKYAKEKNGEKLQITIDELKCTTDSSAKADLLRAKKKLLQDERKLEREHDYMRCLDPVFQDFSLPAIDKCIRVTRSAIIKHDEFTRLLTGLKKECGNKKEEVPQLLITMTDSGKKSKRLKMDELVDPVVEYSACSIVGCTTDTAMLSCFDVDDVGSGLISRICFTYFESKKHKETTERPEAPDVDPDELHSQTEYGRKIVGLWKSISEEVIRDIKEDRVGGCVRQGFGCYRSGVCFDIHDEAYKSERKAFFEYFRDQVEDSIKQAGGDTSSFVTRSKRTFDKLASFFAMVDLPEEDFFRVMVTNAEHQSAEIKAIGEEVSDEESEKILRMVERSAKPVVVTRENAKAAASVLIHFFNSAKVIYPKLLSPICHAVARGVKPSAVSAVKELVFQCIVAKRAAGEAASVGRLRKMHELKSRGFGSVEINLAVEELVAENKIFKRDENKARKEDIGLEVFDIN